MTHGKLLPQAEKGRSEPAHSRDMGTATIKSGTILNTLTRRIPVVVEGCLEKLGGDSELRLVTANSGRLAGTLNDSLGGPKQRLQLRVVPKVSYCSHWCMTTLLQYIV